jgi:hypothetical protein
MGTEHDPLLALRQSIKSKSKVTYTTASGNPAPTLLASTSLIINTLSFPKGTRTRFRRGAGGATDFYTLDAVYVAWLLRDAPGAEYMKQAREHGLAVGFVSVTERKHVVDWLEGKVQESDRIAPLACTYTLFLYSIFYCLLKVGFFEWSSGVDDPTWYTTTNGWAESAYHTSDTGCGGTGDDAFEAPLCGGLA